MPIFMTASIMDVVVSAAKELSRQEPSLIAQFLPDSCRPNQVSRCLRQAGIVITYPEASSSGRAKQTSISSSTCFDKPLDQARKPLRSIYLSIYLSPSRYRSASSRSGNQLYTDASWLIFKSIPCAGTPAVAALKAINSRDSSAMTSRALYMPRRP